MGLLDLGAFNDFSPSPGKGYKNTLEELMQLTKAQLDDAVWLTWAIAQNTSAILKIAASIAYVTFLSFLF